MDAVASFTYETLLAYVLPGSVLEILVLALLTDRLRGLDASPSAYPYWVLGLLAASLLFGLALNFWGTVATSKLCRWQQNRRNVIFFGRPGHPTALDVRICERYPTASEDHKVDVVYALFDSFVSAHVYARRNWDWYYYQCSRNFCTGFPVYVGGYILVALRYGWTLPTIAAGLVLIALLLIIVYWFMVRQLEIYYLFYAHVVLGHLLEHSAQVGEPQRQMHKAQRFEQPLL